MLLQCKFFIKKFRFPSNKDLKISYGYFLKFYSKMESYSLKEIKMLENLEIYSWKQFHNLDFLQ